MRSGSQMQARQMKARGEAKAANAANPNPMKIPQAMHGALFGSHPSPSACQCLMSQAIKKGLTLIETAQLMPSRFRTSFSHLLP